MRVNAAASDSGDKIPPSETYAWSHHRLMQNILIGNARKHVRLQFDVARPYRELNELPQSPKASAVIGATSLGRVDHE